MFLIKNIDVYAPAYLGKKDVLISDKILKIDDHIDCNFCEIIDGTGKTLTPGFIDGHVHVLGGGGEGSYHTKAPEIMLSEITSAGVTTVLGLLGTDGISRDIESLITKVKALKEEGISAYMISGSYIYPPCTITKNIASDILYLDECIGCKLALSDHRSSYVTKEELRRLAADIRVAGMLSGKAGVIILHMGDDHNTLKLVNEIVDETSLPISLFHPTHVNRNPYLLKDAFDFAKKGGYIDLSSSSHFSGAKGILDSIKENVPQDKITMSSDAHGSWSTYYPDGSLKEMGIISIKSLMGEYNYLLEQGVKKEQALTYFTRNVACKLGLKGKGEIKEGYDADLLIFDHDQLKDVLAKGVFHIKDGQQLIYGTFEKAK